MGNGIIRERDVAGSEESKEIQGGERGKIVSEVMGDVGPWRALRDGDFEALWDEYYAKWRGFWFPEHRSYKSERSKLISPLTSMAIDLTAAEIIEAVMGRENFIDLPDNVADEEKADMDLVRKQLVEDLRNSNFSDEFAATILNGCLFGTGLMKIAVNTKIVKTPYRTQEGEMEIATQEVVSIEPVAVEPGSFVGDPGCRDIDEMKGCAHEYVLPLHIVQERQNSGQYYNDFTVGSYNARQMSPNRGDTEEGKLRAHNEQTCLITEWYGLVSERCYVASKAEGNGIELSYEMLEAIPEDALIEVIATIANETHLLRCIENPNPTGERLFAAYQHEVVPNRFYGRGVAEKAANIQRAMDAEMRARIDALAWSNNPMFAGDLTRLPPGGNLNAWPGKFWGTRGNPAEILQEFKVSGPDANSYQHIQDLERMGQQATGALDSASLRSGMRDETATGSALGASSFIKRSKRTMYNVEGFLNRLIRRTLHLKMKFDPKRYPQDYEFSVRGSMGMMAREIEQQQMVNLIGLLGPDSPATMPIIRAIMEHSGSPVRSEVLMALKQMMEKQPTPEEQAAQKAQLEAPVMQVEKIKAEIAKILSEAGLKAAQKDHTQEETEALDERVQLENVRTLNDLAETNNQKLQLELQAEKNDIERAKLLHQRNVDATKPRN
jgi:hypothetical protein